MSVLNLADTVIDSCFDLLTVSFKEKSTMKKTSSFIAFLLALSFLSLFVAPSDARILSMGRSMGRGKGKGKGRPSPSPPPPPPPAPRTQTCPETCVSIARKAPISGSQCTFANCAGNFECQNLPSAAGFQTQTGCSSFCVGFTNLQCPSGNSLFAGDPTSRCLAARCT
jgi:hypothetical protein